MLSRHLQGNRVGLVFGSAIAASVVLAGPVAAQDRCEGTLCDLYYGNAPPPAARPDAAKADTAKPLTAPSGSFFGRLFGGSPSQPQSQQPAAAGSSAPTRRPFVAVQGGGLLGLAQGAPQERCSGTLCDLYYGGPAPERPRPQAEPAATGVEPTPDEMPRSEPPSRVREQPVERHCADGRDPWSCYRR